MARYLVVAHQTAQNPALLETMRDFAAQDPHAGFVLLVPATAGQHLGLLTGKEAVAAARIAAQSAQARYAAEGIHLTGCRVRDPNPVIAVAQELAENPRYDRIIVSTLPPGISRWLKMDVVSRLERTVDSPITHVVARPEPD